LVWNTIFSPSGDQRGRISSDGVFVSRTRLVPSAFIAQMSSLSVTSNRKPEAKTILEPSGDQAPVPSNAGSFVSRRVSPMSRRTLAFSPVRGPRGAAESIYGDLGEVEAGRSEGAIRAAGHELPPVTKTTASAPLSSKPARCVNTERTRAMGRPRMNAMVFPPGE
jgi:hypothetical protein